MSAREPEGNLEFLRRRNLEQEAELTRLKLGGGGGTYDGMDGRVSRLEALVDVTREDLRDIKSSLTTIVGRLDDLPTKADLTTWRWQWLGIGVALFAIIVGTILGGLAWLDPH